MQVADCGEIKTFDEVPRERPYYMTMIRYNTGVWTAGPSSANKDEVLNSLELYYKTVVSVRIYTVYLPTALQTEES